MTHGLAQVRAGVVLFWGELMFGAVSTAAAAAVLISPLKHGCPVVIATHRPSTLTYADGVARPEDGRAVDRAADTDMTDSGQER